MNSTRAIRTWLAVDVLLVTVLLVLVVVVTSGGSPSRPVAAATSPTAAPASPAASPRVEPVRFRLPSGNISCVLTVDRATCSIASVTYEPPPVEGCTRRTGHVIVLSRNGVAFACERGRVPKVVEAGAGVQTLSYGGSVTVGDFTCTSATNGATCVDGTGRGFRIARASWTRIN
jgi:hypothetical protein